MGAWRPSGSADGSRGPACTGSRRVTRASADRCSYRSSQYDSVSRSSRLADAAARASSGDHGQPGRQRRQATTEKVNKTRTLSNGLQQCQPPATIPRHSSLPDQ